MTERVVINHIGAGGDGVADGPDGPIYVPFSVEGDDVEIKVQGKQGRIKHIHSPSLERIEPICKHFGRCGGCSLQHVSQSYYNQWKKNQISAAMRHRGFEGIAISDLEISRLASRRRASITASMTGAGDVVIGFAERASHTIVDVTECPVMAQEIVGFIGRLKPFIRNILANIQNEKDKKTKRKHKPKHKKSKRQDFQKIRLQINLAENGLDVIIEGAGEPNLDLRMDISGFAEQHDIARICWKNTKQKISSYEILCERRKPYVSFDGRQVYTPPGSFLQATKEGEETLIRYMKATLGQADKVVDIFAGCGTFTVSLIDNHAVHAVEGNEDMVAALKSSSHQMGKIRALTTEVRDLFLRPLLSHELNKFDAIVIDPPRAGAREQIEEITHSDVANVVMISCNPATFARDARTLVDAGFTMGEILPVDQFLYSPHLEVIAGFKRLEE